MGKHRERLSFANVVSVISLVFALGLGGAWAATELNRNEVKSKHIKNGGVKNKDLANDAVSSPKVVNGSLRSEDFAVDSIPAGPQGAQGPQGPQGPQGESGVPATKLWAVVNADGTLARGSGVVSSTELFGPGTPGSFQVVFNRDVSNCALLATIGRTDSANLDPPPGQIGTAYRNGIPEGAYVKILNAAGNAGADQPFHLAAFC